MEIAGLDDEGGLVAELGGVEGAAWEGGLDEGEGWVVDGLCFRSGHARIVDDSGTYLHSIIRGVGIVRMVRLIRSGVMRGVGLSGVELMAMPQMLGSSWQRLAERMRWSVRSDIIEGVSQRIGSMRRGILGWVVAHERVQMASESRPPAPGRMTSWMFLVVAISRACSTAALKGSQDSCDHWARRSAEGSGSALLCWPQGTMRVGVVRFLGQCWARVMMLPSKTSATGEGGEGGVESSQMVVPDWVQLSVLVVIGQRIGGRGKGAPLVGFGTCGF